MIRAIEHFLAEVRDEQVSLDRVLTTVMFHRHRRLTDKAAELGDRGWTDLRERHHSTVRALLAR